MKDQFLVKISVGENEVLRVDGRMWNKNANAPRARVRQGLAFRYHNRARHKEELAGVRQWEKTGNWSVQKIETWHLKQEDG